MNWENLRHNTNAKARLCTWVLTSSCDLSLSSGSDFSKQAKSTDSLPNQVPFKVEFLVWSERGTIGISLFPVTLRQWRRCQTKLPDFYKLSTFFHCICFSPRYKRQEYLFSFFSKATSFSSFLHPPLSTFHTEKCSYPMYLSILSLLWLPCISQSCDIARHRTLSF